MIGGTTRIAAVIGHPVAQSMSPAMHNAGFAAVGVDAAYLALNVHPKDLTAVVKGLRGMNALGVSVTMPHKRAVMACCDRITPAAQAIGAVNTLEFCEDGSLVGGNTDAPGFVRAFSDSTGEPNDWTGRHALLLGAGPAAQAVAYGIQTAGATSVVVARSPKQVSWTQAVPWSAAELAHHFPKCDVVIDCTSTGLSEEREAQLPCAAPLHLLSGHSVVCSLVYHREPKILSEAKARGLRIVDGAGMLLFQGAIAFERWTGHDAPIEEMRAALFPTS